jgi:transposase
MKGRVEWYNGEKSDDPDARRKTMSMYPQALGPIPAETARIARAANPKGTLAIWLRDELGAIYRDEEFADLYPQTGQPAFSPWRLALVTLLQYVEDLTDRQAAEAVRERIDWKYVLGLELSDPGFDASVLTEWRERLLAHGAEEQLLERVLMVCRERGWLKAGGKMRTDATHVLSAVRSLHHLETVGETLRAVLEELAQVDPNWLLSWIPEEWFKRYEGRMDSRRLPKKDQERRQLAEQIGRDGVRLLWEVQRPETPQEVQALASVDVLRQVWQQYYEEREGQLHWRDGPAQGAQETIVSPYDRDARRAQKRDLVWCGYKVHVTETCDAQLPELIVQVKTTLAARPDVKETLAVQHELQQRQLMPAEHLLDGGYLESEVLVKQPPGLHIVGPVPPDTSWQALADNGYDLPHFQIDWQGRTARCPQGHLSQSWRQRPERENHIDVSFARATCRACPVRTQCTKGEHRELQLQPQAYTEALQQQRKKQQTREFRQQYALRSGVEATISQGVRRLPMRQSRYRGMAKVQLQEVVMATALNCLRLYAYTRGESRGITWISHLARLKRQREQEQAV